MDREDRRRGRVEDFRALHRPGRPLLLPNAWDVASAVALVDAGFVAVGTTSLGIAAAAGHPDAGGTTRPQTLALVRALRDLDCLLTVDVEAGFGTSPPEVADVVAELADAGAVGVNIEDGRGDRLAPVEEQATRIAAIKDAVPDLFVNARTDTYWIPGAAADPAGEAHRRADAYAAAGADGLFVPGLADPGPTRALADGPLPLNVLHQPGGPTLRELAELGVARVSTGSLLFRAALHAAVTTAAAVAAGEDPVDTGFPGYSEVEARTARLSGPR